MKSNYEPLGKYIKLFDERNLDLEDLPLMGLSVSKVFFPTIANLVGTDMKTYKIVYRNQFTYIADTSRRGDKIAIALNDRFDKMLVSQAYTPFEVKDSNELDPEYLMMWFRRPEFDRYARFKSHGSAREIFDWEEMCNTLLPIPHIDKQREIVKEYNTIQNRIDFNQQLIQKLEETAQAIYKQWFVDEVDKENLPEGWTVGFLQELCTYSDKRISITELSLDTYISTENMLQDKAGVMTSNGLPKANSTTRFGIGNILISNIRPYFKKIWLANFPLQATQNQKAEIAKFILYIFDNLDRIKTYTSLKKEFNRESYLNIRLCSLLKGIISFEDQYELIEEFSFNVIKEYDFNRLTSEIADYYIDTIDGVPSESRLYKFVVKNWKPIIHALFRVSIIDEDFERIIALFESYSLDYRQFLKDKENYRIAHDSVANLVNDATPDWIRDRKNEVFNEEDWEGLKKQIKEERESLFWQFKLNDEYYDEDIFFEHYDLDDLIQTNSIRHLETESKRFLSLPESPGSSEDKSQLEIDELFTLNR